MIELNVDLSSMSDGFQSSMLKAAKHEPLDVDAMDIDVRQPEILNERMGSLFSFSARVEQEVDRDAATIAALLPNMSPQHAAFVDAVWLPQEIAHGKAHEVLLHKIGHAALPLDNTVEARIVRYGQAAAHNERLHRIFFMLYATRGAIHERTTALSYRKQIQMLKGLGETGLVETMFKPILIQEGPHYGMYQSMAKETWSQMSRLDRVVSRTLFAHTYSPVGTGTPEDETKPHFGEIAKLLAGDDVDGFLEPVIKTGHDLMGQGWFNLLDKSIRNNVRDCIGRYEAQQV